MFPLPAAVLSSRAAGAGAGAAASATYGHSLKGVEARIASVLQSLPFPQPATPEVLCACAPIVWALPVLCAVQHIAG